MKRPRKKNQKQDGPSHRIFNPKRNKIPKYRARRTIIFAFCAISLMFCGKIFLGFFDFKHVNVSIALFGNSHYSEGQIYDVLGKNLDNIITDSEVKTVDYLKGNLSYIKNAQVTKNFVKRQLTIEITEREPFARVKYIISKKKKAEKTSPGNNKAKNKYTFYLIDDAGYVLESIAPDEYENKVLILDEGIQEPEIGKQITSETFLRGIRVLKLVMSKKPGLAKDLRSIDARVSHRIILDLQNLPMPVLIAADLMGIGIEHVDLFVKQRGLLILQRERKKANLETITKTRENQKTPLPEKYTYLDARYEDTLYIGGADE